MDQKDRENAPIIGSFFKISDHVLFKSNAGLSKKELFSIIYSMIKKNFEKSVNFSTFITYRHVTSTKYRILVYSEYGSTHPYFNKISVGC